MMAADEEQTLSRMKSIQAEVVAPQMSSFQGRIFKTTGDGFLAEFSSVVNAVSCAVAIQEAMKNHGAGMPEDAAIQFRIGINLGDVMADGHDIFGDGVNVAARLEALAPPGGITVSANVRSNVGTKLRHEFKDQGSVTLKNIPEPVQVFQIDVHGTRKDAPKPLELPDRPSIAVLPFSSMSHDTEQEFFVDGLTEDLITDLSRNRGLFVIARNSTFAYKGRSVDARQIARELGVRYLLEGSARRAANRIRINVQLIDAAEGGHLWADRFDRDSADVFAVQDEITKHIVEALVGHLMPLPVPKRPANLDAYDLCVRGRKLLSATVGLRAPLREGISWLERAIALDPSYAEAHRWLAFGLWTSWVNYNEPMDLIRARAVEAAERAVELDPNDSSNYCVLALVLSYERRWQECERALKRGLELNPSASDTLIVASEIATFGGQPELGIEYARKAIRLDPQTPLWYWGLGLSLYAARRYDEAVATLMREETYRTASRRILAASLAQLGRLDEAKDEASFFMASNPNFTISYWIGTQPIRDPVIQKHFEDGYRKAGLPE